LSRLS